MSKTKNKSKSKKNEELAAKEYNRQMILNALFEAFDRIEGEYSGMPQCCIDVFVNGRTAYDFNESLSAKDQKKYRKWNYVPCDDCFKTNKVAKIKNNGTSHRGKMIMAIAETFGHEMVREEDIIEED